MKSKLYSIEVLFINTRKPQYNWTTSWIGYIKNTLHEKRDISLQTNCDMLCYKVICILSKPSFVTCPNASKDLLSRLHVPYLRNSTTLKIVCMEIWPWKITGFQFIHAISNIFMPNSEKVSVFQILFVFVWGLFWKCNAIKISQALNWILVP